MINLEKKNISVKIGETSYNGGLKLAMITFDMITSREIGQLLRIPI